MCIICNNSDLGDEFINEFSHANMSLKRACEILLEISKKENINKEIHSEDEINAISIQYKKVHKMLVRLRKEINKAENQREDWKYLINNP